MASGDENTKRYKESIVFHSSLSLAQLLGTFDSSGKWMDGFFCRWLRKTTIQYSCSTAKSLKKNELNDTYPIKEMVVLDGPVGASLEQMMSATLLRRSFCPTNLNDSTGFASNLHVSIPSGEMFLLPPQVSIILETSDISQASPSLVTQLETVHIGTFPESLIDVKLRSYLEMITLKFSAYPVWEQSLQSLHEVFTGTYIKDILTGTSTADVFGNVLHSSGIDSFVRALGELLHTCHDIMIIEIERGDEVRIFFISMSIIHTYIYIYLYICKWLVGKIITIG